MARRRIPLAFAWIAAGALSAACGRGSYSSEPDAVRVTGVTLEREAHVLVGKTLQLMPAVLPDGASDPRVTWSSSDDTVVAVTAAGVVSGVGPGTATVTVTTVDGYRQASCAVTANLDHVAVTELAVDPPTFSLQVGSPVTLSARVVPTNASNRNVTWSADSDRVSLSAVSGDRTTVTALREGTTRITATAADGGVQGSCDLTISPVRVTGLALSAPTLSLTSGAPDGTSAPLTALVAPPDATDPSVTWTTSDAAVATIASTSGNTATILAHRAGRASIAATTSDGGFGAVCEVDVTAPDVPSVAVTGVSLDRAADAVLSLEAGSPGTSGTLVATVAPEDATNKNVSWTTSAPGVARLSAATGRAVRITGVAPGTSTITATTEDGARTAAAQVKVWLLDAQIAGTTATALSPGPTGGAYGTRGAEVPLDELLYYGAEGAFSPGDADGGILLNRYASGSRTTPAAVGDSVALAGLGTVVQASSYVGIPAARTRATTPSLKVVVTAKARSGSPRVALWAQGRVIAVSSPLGGTARDVVFDGVLHDVQLNVFDGGVEGSSMYVEAIRVEPSTTTPPDTTPPADVTFLTTTALSPTSMRLSWTNPRDGDLAGVRITYGLPPVTVTVASPRRSFVADNLTLGMATTFTVRAVDRSGNASNGISVSRAGAAPLLDEVLAVNADQVERLVSTSAGLEVPARGSRLRFFGRANVDGGLHFRNVDGKLMWQTPGVDPSGIATGATASPSSVNAYVAIPAAFTATGSTSFPSVRVSIQVSQHDDEPTLEGKSTSLLLLDGANKVLATAALPPGGGAPTTFVFDGAARNGAIRVACDRKGMFLVAVRVEASPTPPREALVRLQ